MTTIVRLTRAELRKLATARTFLITLASSVGLSVISVVATAVAAGKNGTPALGTTASTDHDTWPWSSGSTANNAFATWLTAASRLADR